MTEIDYGRLNAEAKRLYGHAYAAGRSAGTEAENSRLAHEQAIVALELAKIAAERALSMPSGYRVQVTRLARTILYRSCPVTKSPNLNQITARLDSGDLDDIEQALPLIESDLRMLKEGGDRA